VFNNKNKLIVRYVILMHIFKVIINVHYVRSILMDAIIVLLIYSVYHVWMGIIFINRIILVWDVLIIVKDVELLLYVINAFLNFINKVQSVRYVHSIVFNAKVNQLVLDVKMDIM